MTDNEIFAGLKARGQEHVLRYFEELNDAEKREFLSRLSAIDWETVSLARGGEKKEPQAIRPIEGLTAMQIARSRDEFRRAGEKALREGKIGAVLLAGGQGTRFGSDSPKGAFDIGVTRPLYIFECLIRNLREVTDHVGKYVPFFIMTSEKNDAETRSFLRAHDYFGYPASHIRFFVQDMAPAVDFQGKLLLEDRGKLALSPNGNGGWFSSLERSGAAEDFPAVEWLNVFSVDNVLQRIADPYFIGATLLSGMKCGAKVVSKAEPHEKVGVLCLENGLPAVIEYYELSEEMANERNADGELLYRFGVILNYLFDLGKLRSVAKTRIPVHIVKKKIPYLDEKGELVRPEEVNGYKFETLILDMIKLMGSCLPYEVVREREFAPVKNRTGVDSVESARALLAENGVKL